MSNTRRVELPYDPSAGEGRHVLHAACALDCTLLCPARRSVPCIVCQVLHHRDYLIIFAVRTDPEIVDQTGAEGSDIIRDALAQAGSSLFLWVHNSPGSREARPWIMSPWATLVTT